MYAFVSFKGLHEHAVVPVNVICRHYSDVNAKVEEGGNSKRELRLYVGCKWTKSTINISPAKERAHKHDVKHIY